MPGHFLQQRREQREGFDVAVVVDRGLTMGLEMEVVNDVGVI